MSDQTAELLQGLEHVVEEVAPLAAILRHVLEAQQRGERLSEAAIVDYLRQLTPVGPDQERMEETIKAFWSILGKEQSH